MIFNRTLFTIVFLLIFSTANAQFHTLKIPRSSNRVIETQRIGITDITINYGSPSINNRDVWNDTRVIPQNGNPIPWRAGANMNTTIKFSTDVLIEGQVVKAGVYGFHIIPKGDVFTLLFAHNNNQWGSYYLDMEKDITLQVDVKPTECPFSEKLDYEFLNWTEDSVTIGLEWADKRIPFVVSVDLNTTVVESFRHELRGVNTYHWQAWNDAANWCLNHNTNLEEALEWTERSINGGFHGFAANKNFTNLATKFKILKKLNKTEECAKALTELEKEEYNGNQAFQFGRDLLNEKDYDLALNFSTQANKKHPDSWFLIINEGLAKYFLGNTEDAIEDIKTSIPLAPKQYHERFNIVIEEMKVGTYQIPN